MHDSVPKMWHRYLAALGQPRDEAPAFSAWHFCDNETDANECARLVLRGQKQATTPSVWELEASGEDIPETGDVHIVTNWSGAAQCVIRTTAVKVVSFGEVTAEHAALEGEGDGSLEHWRRVHRSYYNRVLEGTSHEVSSDMPVVCERFEVVFPAINAPSNAA
jgi:uncharacterized protein YhfF